MPNDSPISTSSDVWATMVANIAPLLVLVGEKHVKAYFKTMCRTSHHLLFATAPIGLVTAVTTLIRLNGFPLLKRIIGRQFETRAEVLADVTSVSCGAVGLELVNMNLEQAIVPAPENLAMFWVHGKKSGSADEVLEFVNNLRPELMRVAYRSGAPISLHNERRCAWSTLISFRVKGSGAIWLARKYAAQTNGRGAGLLALCEEEIKGLDLNEIAICDGVGCVYARWSDVSLGLTASVNMDRELDVLRYATVVVCFLGNLGIIFASWFTGRDPRNVGLVAAGLFISSGGSWLTAWLVDRASQEEIIDLSALSAFSSGFFSERLPEGVSLSFCPQKVAMSSDSGSRRTNSYQDRQWIASATVGLMVMAYIGLYLGLRTSAWWVSLAMLGNAAIAGLARSLFIPSSLYILPELLDTPERLPDPIFGHMGILTIQDDMILPESQAPPKSQSSLSLGAGNQTPRTNPPQPHMDLRSDPVILEDTYEVVSGLFYTRDNFLTPPGWGLYRIIGTSLQIACDMRRRKIAPLEVADWQNRNIATEKIAILYSDLLSQRGVWRQPLEVILPAATSERPEAILAPFRSWYDRACKNSARKIANLSIDPQFAHEFIHLEGDEDGGIGSVTDKFTMTLGTSRRAIFWMLAKIIYAVHYKWDVNKYEEALKVQYGGPSDFYLYKEEQVSLLDSVIEAGLTCPLE